MRVVTTGSALMLHGSSKKAGKMLFQKVITEFADCIQRARATAVQLCTILDHPTVPTVLTSNSLCADKTTPQVTRRYEEVPFARVTSLCSLSPGSVSFQVRFG